jgi:hypothetical protein
MEVKIIQMTNLLLVCFDETFKDVVTDCINYCKTKKGTSFEEEWEMMFGDSTFEEVLEDRSEAIYCISH